MKPNTLVKFNFEKVSASSRSSYPFTPHDIFVYLGDVVQMPGHGIFARKKDGRVFFGYLTENFAEIHQDMVDI